MNKSEKFKTEALAYPSRAQKIIVHDNNSLTIANDFVQSIKEMRKEVADTFDPIIEKARKARDEALAQKKRYDEPLKEAEKIIKLSIASYLEEQDKIRREAEEKAAREEEERQKKEEEAIERAKKYDDIGMKEEAEAIIKEIPLPELIEEVPRPAADGLAIKKIVDFAKITQLVESSKGRIKIPGIEIYPVWKWKITNRQLIPKSYYKSSIASRVSKVETEIMTQGKPEDA